MASRNIANMHLFLDLKKKFPDLPDDTLRKYTSLYAEDPEECINVLLREIRNHYNPSQPFADFHLAEIRPRADDVQSIKDYSHPGNCNSPLPYPNMTAPPLKAQVPSSRSTSHAGIVHLPGRSINPNVVLRPESHSAPVVPETVKPFNYKNKLSPVSSHTSVYTAPSDKPKQMIFSTTKEHYIQPSPSHESTAFLPLAAEAEPSQQHAVKLSFTPSFPYQHQQFNVYNSSVSTATSYSPRLGRHTTSLNLQLQPQSSGQYPIEISSVPTNIGDPCDSRDFASHVQVSVGSQGATFTALRVQHPSYSPNPSHLSSYKQNRSGVSSSQAEDLTIRMLSGEKMRLYPPASDGYRSERNFPVQSPQYDAVQKYQLSPDYILAVKNHQIAQLDLVYQELEKEKAICSKLKAEVYEMEQELAQQIACKASIFNVEELNKLREENRKLRIGCNCLSMEVDMSNTGLIPLGVTDEDFYSNIFTGPNGALSSSSSKDSVIDPKNLGIEFKSNSFEDDEEDERNRWKCKKCTFANHPALEKCEMCEMSKGSEYIQLNSSNTPGTCVRFVSTPPKPLQRPVGSVQISVTRRAPSSPKSVKLHLTHRRTT